MREIKVETIINLNFLSLLQVVVYFLALEILLHQIFLDQTKIYNLIKILT